MTEPSSPKPPRDARFMAWLQRKNAEYAPALLPLSLVGVSVSFALNKPEFATVFGMIFVGSLTTGKR